MARKLLFLVVLSTLLALPVSAQNAIAVLEAASTAMGADTLNSIEYGGTEGWVGAVGQSFTPGENYPRVELTYYNRTIDYEARSSKEEVTVIQGDYPARGGGLLPIQGERQRTSVVSGNYAWDMEGNNLNPVPGTEQAAFDFILRPRLLGLETLLNVAEVRQLDIWLTPHGFLKAALAAGNATVISRTEFDGETGVRRKMNIVSFTALGKYRVNGQINDQDLVENVQTWVADTVLGDMLYEHRYLDYRDYDGVRFPSEVHVHRGNRFLDDGHDFYEVQVGDVRVNPPVPTLTIPDAVLQAVVPAVRVESRRVADGVWRVAGGYHHSVVIEFRDFVVVVEAPLNEDRSLAVIEEVGRLVPDKPIQYVVNTHHHSDHAGGLRTYLTEGATIVTHEGNREYYEKVVFYPAPRTLEPDRLALNPVRTTFGGSATFQSVTDKYVISDGTRTVDLYAMLGLDHNANMLIAYLPTEKIVVNADLYSPPTTPSASIREFYRNIQRLKLDVEQHVPIHGRVGTMEEFLEIVGETSND